MHWAAGGCEQARPLRGRRTPACAAPSLASSTSKVASPTGSGLLAHVMTTVYVPGTAFPGTLVRPSSDCESVEATSDEKPDGDIHSATSGGWRTAETP